MLIVLFNLGIFIIIMSGVLKYCYRVSKPRIQTTNIKNLAAYKIEMHEARLRLHKESTAYLNKI